jgi:pyruvate dehydrogenase E2 component (dihydrolipoamide acetyltransferase)
MKSYTLSELCTDIDEAQIKNWRVKPGDKVKEGDVLMELECTKVSLQLTAPTDATVTELMVGQGDDISSDSCLITLMQA